MSGKPKVNRQNKDSDEVLFPIYWKGRHTKVSSVVIHHDFLNPFGIENGHYVYYEKVDDWDENRLFVWEISSALRSEKTQKVAFAYDCFGEISLHRGGDFVGRFKPKDLKLLGVVILIGIRGCPTLDEIEESEEDKMSANDITVTCKGCSKSITGSKSYITSLGWLIRKNGAECLDCWI